MNIKSLLRSFTVFVLLLLFALSLVGCQGGKAVTFEVKLVHTNDVHARVEADDEVIGFEKLKTVIDTHKQGADLGLVLDSGDLFHGQSIATLQKGESIARLVKVCGYDAMATGNHDWNYTKDKLPELAEIAGLTVLAGNVVRADGSRFFEEEFLIKEVEKDGITLKVGIMGMIDPVVYSSTSPANVEGLTFTALEEYATNASARLRKQGCQLVIALAHMGSPAELAKKIDGVDLWLCGHEHLSINEKVTTPDGTTSYVVEDAQHLEQVGLISMTVEMNKKGAITAFALDKTELAYDAVEEIEKNADVTTVLDSILKETSGILNEVVGYNPIDLDGEREHVRTSQTNLGNVIASAYLLETGADIAFENGGGIRAGLPKGNVTYGDIISVNPFGNYLLTKQISGKALREAMELSLDFRVETIAAYEQYKISGTFIDPECSGTALHFAGMTMTCDMSKEKGSRVESITVGGAPLDEEKLYTIAVSNYVGSSPDYTMIGEAPELGQFSSCEEAIIAFFRQEESKIAEAAAAVTVIVK